MKYLIPILTLLSFLLLIGIIYTVTTEVSELRDEVGTHREQIIELQRQISISDKNAQRIIDEFRNILEGKRLIPVFDYRTFLVYDEQQMKGKDE